MLGSGFAWQVLVLPDFLRNVYSVFFHVFSPGDMEYILRIYVNVLFRFGVYVLFHCDAPSLSI